MGASTKPVSSIVSRHHCGIYLREPLPPHDIPVLPQNQLPWHCRTQVTAAVALWELTYPGAKRLPRACMWQDGANCRRLFHITVRSAAARTASAILPAAFLQPFPLLPPLCHLMWAGTGSARLAVNDAKPVLMLLLPHHTIVVDAGSSTMRCTPHTHIILHSSESAVGATSVRQPC